MLEAGLVEPPFKPDVSTRMIYTTSKKISQAVSLCMCVFTCYPMLAVTEYSFTLLNVNLQCKYTLSQVKLLKKHE